MAFGDVKLDVCRGGCGGVWFDRWELQKLDEPHEEASEKLLNMERDESIRIEVEQRRKCPRCDDVVLMRHYFSVKTEVEVDECPGCAGYWLDHDELAKIRSLFTSEEEKDQAAEKYFNDTYGTKLKAMQAESKGKQERARRFARLFRFVCPSYYVPGKQRWGAF